MNNFNLLVDVSEGGFLPTRATEGAAGYDLMTPINFLIPPQKRLKIDLQLKMVIPKGYVGWIAPRSGLANKHGIQVMGGIVDSDYRGSVQVIMYNSDSDVGFVGHAGERIAQILFLSVAAFDVVSGHVDENETKRGAGGFGSTGAALF